MNEYLAYKSSGIEWLGNIPDHWDINANRVLFDEISEKSFPDLPVLSVSQKHGIIPQEYSDDEIVRSSENKDNYKRVLPGDLVYNKMRMWQGAVGIAKQEGIVSPAYVVCRPKKNIYPKYFGYMYKTSMYITQSGRYSYGLCDDMNSLRSEHFKLIESILPPLPEQKSIANFLDRETERIDTLIAKKERQIELLQEKRSALITQAVTKGLDPNVKMKDSGVEWLGDIPEHWARKRLKDIGKIRYGLGEPPKRLDNGIPFIRATDIERGKINSDSIEKVDPDDIPWSRKPALVKNDILVVRSGAYTGDSALVPDEWIGAIAGYDMVLNVTKGDAKYVSYSLLSKYLLEGQIYLERTRAAQPHLNAEELCGFYIVTPPLKEQIEISQYLDENINLIYSLIDRVNKSISLLREYRAALISAAVTGKINVTEEVEV
jgi:type I restriction enzyme S subunit